MAADINQLLAQIEDLKRQYTDLTNKPAALFQVSNIREAQAAIDALTSQISKAEKQAADLEAGFGGIYKTVQSIVSELKKGNQPINLATAAFRKLQSSTEKLKLDQQGINKLTKKQLEEEEAKQKIYQQNIRDQALSLIQSKQSLLNDKNGNTLQGAALSQRLQLLAATDQISEQEEAIIRAAKQGFVIFEETNTLLKERIKLAEKEEKSLNRSLGIAGALLGAVGKIPILGESSRQAYEKIKKEAEDTYEETGKHPGAFKNFGKAISETGKILIEKIKDPMVLVGGLVALIVKGFNKFDQAIVGVQKRLALSREEAANLVQEFTTFNTLLSSADLLKSIGAIQDKLGSVGKVTKDSAETFGRLNTFVGLSEEAAAGLTAQADAFGKKASGNYTTAVKTTAQIGKQYKTQLDHKAVLETVGKSSAYTLVQFRGSTQALTEGVAKSKALGISLETVNKSASGLLNFQQSIEDELAAELLTGKQLNLEQARYYALTNQQSKLMDELNSQIGTYSDFTQQTVLAQEAQAKALGMSVEDLSDMLFKQEYMKNTAQEQVLTEAEAIKQRIEQITLADKLQKATDKIAETFANFVAGPIGDFLTSMKGIYTLIGAISGALMGKYISQTIVAIGLNRTLAALTRQEAVNSIAGASADGAASAAKIPGVGWALALPAALAIAGGLVGLLAADDLFSPGGGSGYGKRTLLAPEGAFALNDKDNIIATTNPIRANDLMSTGAGNISVSPGPQTTVVRTAVELNGRKIGNIESIQGPAWGGPRQNGGRIDYSA
jgi:hypothetical protein